MSLKPASPRCQIHNCRMVAYQERVPFTAGDGFMGGKERYRRLMRTVYRCPRRGCYRVMLPARAG